MRRSRSTRGVCWGRFHAGTARRPDLGFTRNRAPTNPVRSVTPHLRFASLFKPIAAFGRRFLSCEADKSALTALQRHGTDVALPRAQSVHTYTRTSSPCRSPAPPDPPPPLH